MDFLDMFTNSDQFTQNSFENDYIKKTLSSGDNTFRIVGKGRFYYVHNFDSANKRRVSSICVKDEDGEGECEICRIYKTAWECINEVRKEEEKALEENRHPLHNFTSEQVKMAEIVAGERTNPIVGFKQSWGAKKFIALNVIDRQSRIKNDEEKHTSLLCKNDYDVGISAAKRGIYEQIVKLLTRHRKELKEHYSKGHDWMPFDITLIKEGSGMDTSYDKERGESTPLTKEELAYKRYDLLKITQPTDAKILRKWLTVGTGTGKNDAEKDAQTIPEPKSDIFAPDDEVVKESPFKIKEDPKVEPKKEEPTDACPSCDKEIPISSSECEYCGCKFSGYTSSAESDPY